MDSNRVLRSGLHSYEVLRFIEKEGQRWMSIRAVERPEPLTEGARELLRVEGQISSALRQQGADYLRLAEHVRNFGSVTTTDTPPVGCGKT